MPGTREPLPVLTLGALGVVFGDIGTSPLYALRQCFEDAHGLAGDPRGVIGVVSLILWSIGLVVCVKYLGFVMAADHDGEGGTFALLGLVRSRRALRPTAPFCLLALFAAALLYGDGVITPSISVLSAVEGLGVATKALQPAVVPLAVGILVALFLLQHRGTDRVGRLFGPVMVAWFAAIAALGVVGILRRPGILRAFDPRLALDMLVGHGWTGILVLGAVVLAFSGTEALFADLGHFGRRPITLAWYAGALPALALNYLGQGAAVLAHPDAAGGPFYALVPGWAVTPMVALSTAATVIASQAVISGAFSLTQQAVNMGFAPRYAIVHTSRDSPGQIYMPAINLLLMLGCIGIVLAFRSSDRLGAAYGLAVIGTMTITSILFHAVARRVWDWSAARAGLLVAAFLMVDLAFLAANLTKLLSGAWVPLAIAALVFAVLLTWTAGHAGYRDALLRLGMPLEQYRAEMRGWASRDRGTAVFLTPDLDRVPLVAGHEWLRRNLRQERVLLLHVETASAPRVPDARRLELEEIGDGLFRATARFGFMAGPSLAGTLRDGLPFEWKEMVFVLPEPLVPEPMMQDRGGRLHRLRCRLFLLLRRTGLSPQEYFGVPPEQSLSAGIRLDP